MCHARRWEAGPASCGPPALPVRIPLARCLPAAGLSDLCRVTEAGALRSPRAERGSPGVADLEGPPASPPCPAPAPAVALRRPLLGRCSPVLTERGTRQKAPELGVLFPQLCPPGGRRLLTLCPGTTELPEDVVLFPRPPGGDLLRPQCLVRPGGCLPTTARLVCGESWTGLGLHPSRWRPVSHRRLVTSAAHTAPWTARARPRARPAPGGTGGEGRAACARLIAALPAQTPSRSDV